jgi:tryptophanyl-tRNA synthetase
MKRINIIFLILLFTAFGCKIKQETMKPKVSGPAGEVLVEPQAKHTEFTKVLGLDGKAKMSKSLDNHIEIAATPEEIWERVRMMVTDPARRYRNDPGHPEVCNVFRLHGFFSADEVDQIEDDCRSAAIGCVECKKRFAQNLSDYFAPFRERRAQYAADADYVWDVLADGAQRAGELFQEATPEGLMTAMLIAELWFVEKRLTKV